MQAAYLEPHHRQGELLLVVAQVASCEILGEQLLYFNSVKYENKTRPRFARTMPHVNLDSSGFWKNYFLITCVVTTVFFFWKKSHWVGSTRLLRSKFGYKFLRGKLLRLSPDWWLHSKGSHTLDGFE